VKEEVNMATQTKEVATQEKAVVQWKGEAITITFRDVKSLICPLATDQETAVFLKTCQSLQLNPFAGEVYLIKYSERDKAATVIAIDSYLKAGEANPQFDGFESGIILKDSTGELKFREGAFLLDEERAKLVGGWAKVYRKDRTRPFYVAVNKRECIRYRRDGSPTEFWTEEKQPSMLRKVALKRALVEAFPSLFSGVISNVDYEALPAEVKETLPEPKGETPEGEIPPAYEKAGEANWKKWWARQKEKGLTPNDVHNILGISSLKEDWIEKGRTLEEAEDTINNYLEKRVKAEPEKTQTEKPKTQPAQPVEEKLFKTWGELAQAAAKLGVNPSDVFKRAGVKKWEDFTDFRDAWNYVEEIVTERAQKPKML
jgi:phage recombination protein Bet